MLPEKDRYTMGRREAVAHLQVLFGGRVAEEMFCDDITSGAAMDIRMATELAQSMVLDWGMSQKLGPIRYSPDEGTFFEMTAGRNVSDKTAALIDEEVERIIREAFQEARTVLEGNREKLDRLAQALLKYETLDGKEVSMILDGKMITRSPVGKSVPATKPQVAPTPAPKPETDTDPGLTQTMPQPG